MRKLIAVAALLIVASAANHLPNPDAYFDRKVLCRWMGAGDQTITIPDAAAAEEEFRCPLLAAGLLIYQANNECFAKCDPALITALILERANSLANAVRERVRSIFVFSSLS